MHKSPATQQNLSLSAGIVTACLCTLFGANAVAIKISLAGLGVFTTAGIRFGIASAAIFLWARLTGRTFDIRGEQVHQMIILAIVFTVQLSLFYLGLSKTNASRGTLLLNLQPFFTLFLAHFFIPDDRMTLKKTIGILMGFGGVAFVFLEKKGVAGDFQSGDLMILAATFIWSCNAVYTKRIVHDYEPFQVVLYPMLFSVPIFFVEGFVWDTTMIDHVDSVILGALIYQSLVTASFGFVIWIGLLQKYGAVALHSFLFIMPIAGVLLGGLVLGEPITTKILVALLLIVSGILVVHFKQKKIVPVFPVGKNL